MTYYVLFVISLSDRVVHIVGMTIRPDEAWMLQIGRNLLDDADGVLFGKRYLIIDRDTKYKCTHHIVQPAKLSGGPRDHSARGSGRGGC